MFYKPSYKTVMVCLSGGLFGPLLLFVLFLELNQSKSFIHDKTLIQEGIDEQIYMVLLHI
jgi:hypothetical protein